VHDRLVLDVASRANPDVMDVAADHDPVPDAAVGPDLDIAHDDAAGRQPGTGIDARTRIPIAADLGF
jgi:hypothetical protein